MKDNLLIIGFGMYGSVVKEIAEALNIFEKISFLDDNVESEHKLGNFADYEKFSAEYSYAIPALGNAKLRCEWIEKLENAGYKIPVLVHPKAYVSPSAQVMKGTVVEPMSVVHANTIINTGCIISAGAVVNHNCSVGSFCHVNCNATLGAGTVLEDGTKITCGETVGLK